MADAEAVPKRTRMTRSAEERAEWLWLFEQSGKTAAESCREHGLSQATLSFWRQQTQGPTPPPGDGSFVEVALPKAPIPEVLPQRASVTLPSGWRIDVPVGTDIAWLTGVLQALTAVKC